VISVVSCQLLVFQFYFNLKAPSLQQKAIPKEPIEIKGKVAPAALFSINCQIHLAGSGRGKESTLCLVQNPSSIDTP